MKTVLLFAGLLINAVCFAQESAPAKNTAQRYADTMPTMLDGSEYGPVFAAALHRTVEKKKLLPELKVQNRIFINFVVDSLGYVGQGKGVILNGNKFERLVEDAEIQRAVAKLPRLTPGTKNGRNVSISMMIPLF